MDQVMVDCADDPISIGDPVIFFGAGDGGVPTAAEWAAKLDTIHYEVVTSMVRPRLTRTVLGRHPDPAGRHPASATGSHQASAAGRHQASVTGSHQASAIGPYQAGRPQASAVSGHQASAVSR